MSISYSGIIGHGSGKATLPSVDSWGNNMNILRDPPKSVQTRQYNNHILMTSEITQMIQDSGDRVNEAIIVYPRGVNQMVDVSYDNYVNKGGQRRGNKNSVGLVDNSTNSGKQSYLPYRIMQGGAFRPPTRDQRELLPLSRLPRAWTSSYTQPGFADFTKKLQTPSPNEKGTKKSEDVLRWSIRPTTTYKIETPLVETYEVKNVIKKVLPVPKTSGIQPLERYNGEISEPVHRVISEPRKAEINLNKGTSEFYIDAKLDHMNTTKYTHDMLYGDNNTNISQNIQSKPIDKVFTINKDRYTHDMLEGDTNTNISQNIQSKPIDKVFRLDKDRYTHDMILQGDNNTNISQNIQSKPIDKVFRLDKERYTHDMILQGDNNTNISQNIQSKPIDKVFRLDKERYTHDTTLQFDTNTNKSQSIQSTPIDKVFRLDKDRYTHDVTLKGDTNTNKSQSIQVTSIDKLYQMDMGNKIKDLTGIYYDTPQTSYAKYDYIHDDMELQRRLPYHESRTNAGYNIHKQIDGEITHKTLQLNRPSVTANTNVRAERTVDNLNRNYNLKPTINIGGFEAVPSIPTSDRQNNLQDFDTDKSRMRQRIYTMQQDRNVSMGNVPYRVQENPV